MIIDTHVHINDKRYDKDREKLIKEFESNNLESVIAVGFDLQSSKEVFDLSQKHNNIYSAIGVHPHDAKDYVNNFEVIENFITKNANNKKVVAIGEIGLDYFRNESSKEEQVAIFENQIKLANKVGLPIVIHCRDAYGDTLEILKKNKQYLNNGGVMHCYSGSVEFAKEVLKLGFYISFAGPVTFKNAGKLIDVVKSVPFDKMLIETDCPYLCPEPKRGQRNEPKYVRYVADKIANILEKSYSECYAQFTKNTKEIFKKMK